MCRFFIPLLVLFAGCSSSDTRDESQPTLHQVSRTPSRTVVTHEVPNLAEQVREVTYEIPFPHDVAAWVAQGNDQAPSHLDDINRFAFDFELAEGTPVCAAADGVVARVRIEGPSGTTRLEDGNYVAVKHDDDTYTVYLHLKTASSLVAVGDMVKCGQILAFSGNSGRSTGPHLHFARLRTTEHGPGIGCRFADVPGCGVPTTGQRVGPRSGRYRSLAEEL